MREHMKVMGINGKGNNDDNMNLNVCFSTHHVRGRNRIIILKLFKQGKI